MKFSLSKLIFASLTLTLLTSTSCPLWAMGGKKAGAPGQDDTSEKRKKRPNPEKSLPREPLSEDDVPLMERMPPAAQNPETTEDDILTAHDEREEGRPSHLPGRSSEKENLQEAALRKQIQALYNSPDPSLSEFIALRRFIPQAHWSQRGLSFLPDHALFTWKLPFVCRWLTDQISPDISSNNTIYIRGDKRLFILEDQGVLKPDETLLLGAHTLQPLSMTAPEVYDDLYKSLITLIINRVNAYKGSNAHLFWDLLMTRTLNQRPNTLVSQFFYNFLPYLKDITNEAIVSAFASWSTDSRPDKRTGHFLAAFVLKRFPFFSNQLIKDFLLQTDSYVLEKMLIEPVASRLRTLAEELRQLDNPDTQHLHSLIRQKVDVRAQVESPPPHLKNVKFPDPATLRHFYILMHDGDRPFDHFSRVFIEKLASLVSQPIELTADHLRKAGLWEICTQTAEHIDPECPPQQKFSISLLYLHRVCDVTSTQLEQLGVSRKSYQILNLLFPKFPQPTRHHGAPVQPITAIVEPQPATAAPQSVVKEKPVVVVLSSEDTNPQASSEAPFTVQPVGNPFSSFSPLPATAELQKEGQCLSSEPTHSQPLFKAPTARPATAAESPPPHPLLQTEAAKMPIHTLTSHIYSLNKLLNTTAAVLRKMGLWDAFVTLRGSAKVNPNSDPEKKFRITGHDLLTCGATKAQLKTLGASPLALKALDHLKKQPPAPVKASPQKVSLPSPQAAPQPPLPQQMARLVPTKIVKKMTNTPPIVPPKKRKTTLGS
jgi:hypothetical protein